jgi:hypothetical protein
LIPSVGFPAPSILGELRERSWPTFYPEKGRDPEGFPPRILVNP